MNKLPIALGATGLGAAAGFLLTGIKGALLGTGVGGLAAGVAIWLIGRKSKDSAQAPLPLAWSAPVPRMPSPRPRAPIPPVLKTPVAFSQNFMHTSPAPIAPQSTGTAADAELAMLRAMQAAAVAPFQQGSSGGLSGAASASIDATARAGFNING